MNAVRRALLRVYLAILHVLGLMAMRSENAVRFVLRPGHEQLRWNLGQWRAWLAVERARGDVPAYQRFLAERGDPEVPFAGWMPDLAAVPATDKENYVRAYGIEERCRGGALPRAGAMIDESSGTSGTANNWVRGAAERAAVGRALQIGLRHRFGHEPIFVINAFALGPWATGMNVSMSVVDISILKSTGPDLKKIENTLLDFGPKYRYILLGYPPFLKAVADLESVQWQEYDIVAIFGGEGMSEAMRRHLEGRFRKVYGSYGASDLEINLAAETDMTVALRRRLEQDAALRERLLTGPKDVLPMVFQYNPMDYYVETNAAGELLVTVTRPSSVSPKLRYNIRDLGHVVRTPMLKAALEDLAIEDPALQNLSELPVLFHYGRADQSIAYYGCKITPASIEEIIFGMQELVQAVESFMLVVSEDDRANKRLTIALELRDRAAPPDLPPQAIAQRIIEELQRVNQDFRESIRMVPPGLGPTVELHAHGAGPFAGHDIRLKRKYIQKRP